jgi:hypothetical protein
MSTTEADRHFDEQLDAFERLRNRINSLLGKFGSPDSLIRDGDYAVHGDYSGHPQVVVFVHNLKLLQPALVSELQQLIREFPGWEIELTVTVRGHYDDWPNMGLYIRPHEIVDGLQRQYFPKEFQNLEYEGARRGTAYD